MPVGNLKQANPTDRSALPAWPEHLDSVRALRDSHTVSLHMEFLDYNPRVLDMLFGAEYVLALEFSRLYRPMWWLDEIRSLQSETSSLLAVSRGPGENVPAGTGASGDGQRAPDGAGGDVPLESDGRQHDYVSAMALLARLELSHSDSVDVREDIR